MTAPWQQSAGWAWQPWLLASSGLLIVALAFAGGLMVGKRMTALTPAAPVAPKSAVADVPAPVTEILEKAPVAPIEPAAAPVEPEPYRFYEELTKPAKHWQNPSRRTNPRQSTPPPPATKPSRLQPSKQSGFSIQVSSFAKEPQARAFAQALRRQNLKPFVVAGNIVGKGTWYRVRIGHYTSHHQARQAEAHLAKVGVPGWIVKND